MTPGGIVVGSENNVLAGREGGLEVPRVIPRWKFIADHEVLCSLNSGASLQSALSQDFQQVNK